MDGLRFNPSSKEWKSEKGRRGAGKDGRGKEGRKKRRRKRGKIGKGHSSALPVATSHVGATEVALEPCVLHLTGRVETQCSVGPGDDQASLPSRQK